MDESLSDFKEKRTAYTGPKNSQKPAVPKGKTKKAPKRIRGQKDIRTALKPKKNELLAYTKEFNEVCRKSGIDVDAEQLQLAIALSKSEENECSSIQSGQSLSSQERTGRIRTTLKEYGFVVPEVKIASNKRKKKLRKNYKLLLTSEEEKNQIISDKFSNILFENVDKCKVISNDIDVTDKRLYYLATSIPYVDLKNNDVLYVDNMIERSSSKGSLLRDWSDIPGRPQSPKPNKVDIMNFSEIECSQEELDVVLSGTIKSTKNIMNNKANVHNAPRVLVTSCDNYETIGLRPSEDKIMHKSFKEYENRADDCSIAKEKSSANDNTNKKKHNSFLTTLDRVRSCSPDIFDEEVSAVYEYSNNSLAENCKTPSIENIMMDLTKDYNQKHTNVNMSTLKYNNDGQAEVNDVILDKTKSDFNQESENYAGPKIYDILKDDLEVTSHFAQTSNCTERKYSNDFMEITACVLVSSEIGSNVYSQHKSNLSQIKNKTRRITNDLMEITECVKPYSDNIEDNIDLTQNSDDNKDVTTVNVIVHNATENVIDISQSSHSEDELPFVQMSGCNKSSFDDTILLDSDEIIININLIKSVSDTNVVALYEDQEVTENINLIETPSKQTKSQSFFDEFIHNHSDDTNNENSVSSQTSHNQEYSKVNDIEIDLTQPNFKTSDIYDEEVDLTQSSDSFDAKTSNKSVNTLEKSRLGKKDEVSIDYDEMFDDMPRSSVVTNSKIGDSSKDTVTYDVTDYGDEAVLENQSQSSEKFNINDKEFEYSLNKSRNDFARDVNFGGISILEYVSCENKTTGRISVTDSLDNRTMSDSYLPIVNIRKDLPLVEKRDMNKIKSKDVGEDGNKKTFEEDGFSACNIKENAFTTDSPTNNKYIVKTDQVTPMLDYGGMSTPERNRELDKYGLKPFKRKRAIQLLTHLYNQTHPLVEACSEDLPSPSKKKRYSSQPSPIKPLESPNKFMKSPSKSQNSPHKLLKSPHKPLKSPKKFSQNELQSDINEDSNLYEVTNELPDIKDIACSKEDWIFQKREKAKVHTCRVPLHIALHNYVTSRRRLREAILKYEPVNIDVIHKELVASGHRYDPKDLLKYMDKKCITVKTADNNARNNRR